ncbi:MAG: hypothetical protein OEY36_04210 [Gammaproteobacteria bacterium]|nr:hypothetical protein [Gammaproteobacteria bacterium]
MKLIKRLLFLLLISASIYLGYFIKQQGTGLVLIQYQSFTIETSVFVFGGFIILLFIVCYVLLRSLLNLIRMPEFISRSYSRYQNNKSSSGLIAGLTDFSEGRFKKAETNFIRQASGNKNSFLNYLLAARAAQLLHADSRRDNYLKQAHDLNPDAEIAIGLTQAELQLSHQQNEMALATLNQLIATHPKHEFVMRLMSRAYLQLEDWAHLCPLLKDIKQTNALPEDVLLKTEKIAYAGYLKVTGLQRDISKLESIWQGMPKYLKKDTANIQLYASLLINNNELKRAESVLRDALNKQWNDELIAVYARFVSDIKSDNTNDYFNELLASCQKWLKSNPRQANLLLAAGKICTVLHLWGKARAFFESSLACQPQADTYLQLALLTEQSEDSSKAQAYYQQGLKFCQQKDSAIL